MKKTIVTIAAAAILAVPSVFSQSATLAFSLGNMYSGTNTNTALFPVNGLVNVLVLTNGASWSSFGSLNTLFKNLTNSWVPAGAARVSFQGADGLGSYGGAPVVSLTGGVATGQEFLVVGYSSLTTASSQPGNNTDGFFYREASWVLPSAGSAVNFFAETVDYGGLLPENTFTSGAGAAGGNGFTTVPEPSTYALLAMGAAALGGYVIRRRKRD